jgi:hypothetical protein
VAPLVRGARRLTAEVQGSFAPWPDFLIIGAAKAGTTTLYRYLCQQDGVLEAKRKEVHYFDLNYTRGQRWYRSHFPRHSAGHGGRTLTGEASPYYLFHPQVPQRVAAAVPRVRLIAMLRNPVDRAYSHWAHFYREGIERRSFEDALAHEFAVLPAASRWLLRHPDGHSHDHRFSSYCARGRYLEQLRLWEQHFPRDQLLVIISERLFAEPAAELLRVSRFLGLGSPSSDAFPPRNVGHYGELSPGTRERLADYFRQPNQELADYLGSDPGWDG